MLLGPTLNHINLLTAEIIPYLQGGQIDFRKSAVCLGKIIVSAEVQSKLGFYTTMYEIIQAKDLWMNISKRAIFLEAFLLSCTQLIFITTCTICYL